MNEIMTAARRWEALSRNSLARESRPAETTLAHWQTAGALVKGMNKQADDAGDANKAKISNVAVRHNCHLQSTPKE